MTAPIVKALRCIHSGAAIQGPSALPFEVLWRCYSRSQVKTPGDRIQDQDFQVSGVYRPLRTKRALAHPIAIQNMRFDWEKNCGIIPLKWRYLWNLTGDKFDPKNDPKYLIFLVVLRSKRPLSWIFPYYCTILLLYHCSHFQKKNCDTHPLVNCCRDNDGRQNILIAWLFFVVVKNWWISRLSMYNWWQESLDLSQCVILFSHCQKILDILKNSKDSSKTAKILQIYWKF